MFRAAMYFFCGMAMPAPVFAVILGITGNKEMATVWVGYGAACALVSIASSSIVRATETAPAAGEARQ